METKNTNLEQKDKNQKTENNNQSEKNQNRVTGAAGSDSARIFNAGEFSETNQNRITGQAGQETAGRTNDSSIPNEPVVKEWNENEKARDDQKMYVAKEDNKNPRKEDDLEEGEEEV